jgi:LPXTG-motif cell wall-anchored protein
VKKPTLANTGLDVTTGALSALVLGALGAVAVIASRRRNA